MMIRHQGMRDVRLCVREIARGSVRTTWPLISRPLVSWSQRWN